ncbi:MAG: nucleotidyltransferase domain-containing protein [Steroidobacteraceae bacterium]
MATYLPSAGPPLFRTVPIRNDLEFWDGNSLNAFRVVDFLGLKRADVARLAGLAPSSVRFDQKMPRDVLGRLTDVATLCELVAEYFRGNAARTASWFRTANPLLGNVAPRDMIRFGQTEKLTQFIMEALAHDTGDEWQASLYVSAESAASQILKTHAGAIERLCRHYAVRRLSAFGSVTRGDFDPARSDIDLAVEFSPSTDLSPARQYFDFKAALESLFGRPVDLVELNAMADSRLKRVIERTQVPIYAEAA